jgi:hypothetical protein
MSAGVAIVRPLAESLGLEPGDVLRIVRHAGRAEAAGRVEEAVETLTVAAILDPREVAVWDALARCLARAGHEGRAASAARLAKAVRMARERQVERAP